MHTGSFDDSIHYKSLGNKTMTGFIRSHYDGTLVAAGGYNFKSAYIGINNQEFDLVAMGRPFIANPTLINQLTAGLAIKAYTPELLNNRLY